MLTNFKSAFYVVQIMYPIDSQNPLKTRSNSEYVSQQLLQNITNAEIRGNG